MLIERMAFVWQRFNLKVSIEMRYRSRIQNMYILDLGSNEKGQLYTQKLQLPNGLFLSIKHTIANKLSLTTKQINFVNISFNRLGDRFIACDLHGNIYMFDLNYNRFMRLNRIGTTCTALAYNLKCKTEYLVATIDGTIKCFNAETRDLVGWMKGHEKQILSLSVHSNGEQAISFSSDVAQLWDLKTFECKQKLNIDAKKNVEIMRISFAPSTNDIVCIFKDDSIYVWSGDKIELKCQFDFEGEDDQMVFYRAYSVSGDGKLLVAAGRSNTLHIYSIENKALLKQVTLSRDEFSPIKDCHLLTGAYENKILLVLTQDGYVEAIDLTNDKIILCLNKKTHQNANEKITSMSLSPNSRYLVAVSENGSIQIYDLDMSQVAKCKTTSNLMKSTIITSNSTSNATVTEAPKKPLANLNTTKQRVCKRAQQMLSNDQIYSKLVRILKCYGEYPSRYRMFIWKLLLRLPENYEAYGALIEKDVHPAFVDLHKKYPIKSPKCTRMLQRTLSVLAHWSPIFAECQFIPLMIFPFVKLFQNNHMVCFEMVATLVQNWCQFWFEFHPNPPINILDMVENLIAYHDKSLMEHFMHHRITSQIYAWSLLETLFSEVFAASDWQILFDNIFSNQPGYMLFLVAAYSICNRSALLKCTEIDDAMFFYRHRNPITVHQLIRETDKLIKCTPNDINAIRLLAKFEPLSKQSYPILNKRPKFISDYQLREKSKILQQELDYLKERDSHLESHKRVEGKKLENEYVMRQMACGSASQARADNFVQFKENMQAFDRSQTNININVTGRPVHYTNARGIEFFNKMKKIDENFSDLENNLQNDLTPESVENGFIKHFANDDESDVQLENGTKCLNNCETDSQRSESIFSLDRGRETLETQERELMKRVYDLRKNLALENRK